jgi:hypothetical protein
LCAEIPCQSRQLLKKEEDEEKEETGTSRKQKVKTGRTIVKEKI